MKKKTLYIQILLTLIGLFVFKSADAQVFQFESIIQSESSIVIEGNSNVTNISCRYATPFPVDTLFHTSTLKEATFLVSGDSLKMEIDLFDCGKKAINRDLRKTLKYKSYPTITAWINKIFVGNKNFPSATISVKIANVVQNYEVPLVAIEDEETITRISGEQEIRLSDFKLNAPNALFGLIKVSDIFNVRFNLHIGKKKGS